MLGAAWTLSACASGPRTAPLPPPHSGGAPLPLVASPRCALPDDLGGDVVLHDAAEAVRCLVHVRQQHVPPGVGTRNLPPAEASALRAQLADINDVQRDIYSILRALARSGYREVFVEGLTVERPYRDDVAIASDYVGRLIRFESTGCFAAGALQRDFVRHGRDEHSGDPAFEAIRYAPGADLLLAMRGEVALLPAESEGLHADAVNALVDADLHDLRTDERRRLFDAREDALLELVSAHGAAGAVTLLGGAHDLSDNVRRWNARHPSKRIALVVITPASYRD